MTPIQNNDRVQNEILTRDEAVKLARVLMSFYLISRRFLLRLLRHRILRR